MRYTFDKRKILSEVLDWRISELKELQLVEKNREAIEKRMSEIMGILEFPPQCGKPGRGFKAQEKLKKELADLEYELEYTGTTPHFDWHEISRGGRLMFSRSDTPQDVRDARKSCEAAYSWAKKQVESGEWREILVSLYREAIEESKRSRRIFARINSLDEEELEALLNYYLNHDLLQL